MQAQHILKHRKMINALCLIACLIYSVSPAYGQPPELEATAPPMRFEAIAGEPFGVATLELPIPAPLLEEAVRVSVFEANERVFYPTVSTRAVELELKPLPPSNRRVGQGRLIERLRTSLQTMKNFRIDPRVVTIHFLFRGSEPLQIKLAGSLVDQIEIPVSPKEGKLGQRHQEIMQQWWNESLAVHHNSTHGGTLQPTMPLYLADMLQRRLNLKPSLPEYSREATKTEPENRLLKDFDSRLLEALKLLGGMQDERIKLTSQMLFGNRRDTDATLDAPTFNIEPARLSPDDLEALGIVDTKAAAESRGEIEPLANHVPPEWIYIRFGSFSNYLWFQSLSDRHGGDVAQMVTLRGVSSNVSERIENLLNTRMTAIAKLFGDSVIEDMAIVGRDLYIQEGPSLGVLFRAKNRLLLLSSMNSERSAEQKRLAKVGAKLETLKINGREVSYLYTPDMRLRSFMVAEGSQVLVTSSRTMVERFLQIADGAPSMAATDAFQAARTLLPASNQYSIFAYISPEFLRGLLSPQYQIELRRRAQAQAALDMADMATWVAQSEGLPGATIEELITNKLLPDDFMDRADGSMVIQEEGKWRDTLRGYRGAFLPIADIEIGKVTAGELEQYQSTLDYFNSSWRELDPILVGIRRFEHPQLANREQVIIEAYVAPFRSDQYGWLTQILGPPSPDAIVLPEDDIANLQLYLAGMPGTGTPNHQLFVGIKDLVPPDPAENKGLLRTLLALQSLPAYIGAWPAPGILDTLFPTARSQSDAAGFTRMLLGLWRWTGDGFSVLSFDRSILETAAATVRPEQQDNYAQGRLAVKDLSGSQIEPWLNRFWYRRGLQVSLGNAAFLNAMEQQFHLKPKTVLQTTEELVGAKLQCPIGGKFRWSESSTDSGIWTSDRWPNEGLNPETALLPNDYKAPWIDWCRGLKLHLSQLPESLAVLGIIELEQLPQPEAAAPAGTAPTEKSLFSIPFQVFGGSPKSDKNPGETKSK